MGPMRRALVLAAACLLIAACSDGVDEGAGEGGTTDGTPLHSTDTTDSTVPTTAHPSGELFGWNDLGDGTEEGWLEVPLDYDDPEGEMIRLYVSRHPAVDPARRIGTLKLAVL